MNDIRLKNQMTPVNLRPIVQKQVPTQQKPPTTEVAPQAESFKKSEGAGAGLITPQAQVGKASGKTSPSTLALAGQGLKSAVATVATALSAPVAMAFNVAKDVLTGGVRQSHFEHKIEHKTETAAQQNFEEAKGRLFDPNAWKQLGPGFGAAKFEVYDGETAKPKGQGVAPAEGDRLKIKLPDLMNPVWVNIDEIQNNEDSAKVVVTPSSNPTKPNDPTIIHFFSEETQNVFQVKRDGNTVTSSVTGVNEKLNTSGTFLQQSVSAARLAGAWMGGKVPQWKAFTNRLLEGYKGTKPGLVSSNASAGMQAALGSQQAGKGSSVS